MNFKVANRILNQVQVFFKHRTLYYCTGYIPMKPALHTSLEDLYLKKGVLKNLCTYFKITTAIFMFSLIWLLRG